MVKKNKIREEFDVIFKSGDEKIIKNYLEKYPWLLQEISSEMDDVMLEQKQILAALGVMEDDLGSAVTINDIENCLKNDFNIKKTQQEIEKILQDIVSLNLIKKEHSGWTLTNEGERICDSYLNEMLEDIEL